MDRSNSLPILPEDVLLEVFDYALYTRAGLPSQEALSLLRLSRWAYLVVLPRLCSLVALTSDHAFFSFLRSLADRPRLGSLVRHLWIGEPGLSTLPPQMRALPRQERGEMIVRLFRYCGPSVPVSSSSGRDDSAAPSPRLPFPETGPGSLVSIALEPSLLLHLPGPFNSLEDIEGLRPRELTTSSSSRWAALSSPIFLSPSQQDDYAGGPKSGQHTQRSGLREIRLLPEERRPSEWVQSRMFRVFGGPDQTTFEIPALVGPTTSTRVAEAATIDAYMSAHGQARLRRRTPPHIAQLTMVHLAGHVRLLLASTAAPPPTLPANGPDGPSSSDFSAPISRISVSRRPFLGTRVEVIAPNLEAWRMLRGEVEAWEDESSKRRVRLLVVDQALPPQVMVAVGLSRSDEEKGDDDAPPPSAMPTVSYDFPEAKKVSAGLVRWVWLARGWLVEEEEENETRDAGSEDRDG